jgi:pyridoxal phosphate-dependent aminotransferase EpsN
LNKSPRIYLSPPHLSGLELAYIQQAFASNWVAPVGENLARFEQAVCNVTQAKYALALNAGTAAIHLGLRALGVGAGDIVICPSFTFIATANPILYLGATPIFIDSEAETWNISPEYLEKALIDCKQKNKLPKAIIVVHLYGQAAQMYEIQQIAQHYQIPILEDSAEALGSTYQGRALGTLGDIGIYSFNGNKIITTSAGGMLVTDSKEIYEKSLFRATQAKEKAPHYQHNELGYNYRLSNILAGIGCGQMEVLPERIRQRRSIYTLYQQFLANELAVTFLTEMPDSFSNRWLTCVLFRDEPQREQVRLALSDENIEARPLWKPLHLQPLFQDFHYYGAQIAESLFEKGLCLPSGSQLQTEDIVRITEIVRSVVSR